MLKAEMLSFSRPILYFKNPVVCGLLFYLSQAMHIDLHLQQDYILPELSLDDLDLTAIIHTTLQQIEFDSPVELGIACVDETYSQQLNAQYRQKDKPTNVLSFPSEIPADIVDELDYYPLGDLVICLPVVWAESQTQGKTVQQHFIHLVVHGVLHLLGYDHEISPEDAEEMEQLEIEILAQLGIANPYQEIE